MRWITTLLLVGVLLASCGSAAQALTPNAVFNQMTAAGLEAQSNTRALMADGVPKTYTGWQFFEVPSLHNGRGGQIFVCDTKKDCDAIYEALTQPRPYYGYVYQSPAGRVVVQLDGTIQPTQAVKYETVIKELP